MKMTHDAIIAAMTLDDKVNLLTGKGLWRTASFPELGIDDFVMTDGTYGVRYSTSQIEQGENWNFKDFIAVVNQQAGEQNASHGVEKKYNHTEHNDVEQNKAEQNKKKGSEALFSQSKPATCFPNGSTLACSWDTSLVYQMGQALAKECQTFGVGLLLGPGINIRRTPLAGRGYEYYSEDPVVSGDLAAALINGLQDEGIGASLKHFACNNSEFRRTEMDSIVDERALREIYLLGFERAIKKSNPWTVMSSYNVLNGIQTSHHPFLLTQVLRNEWQYDGLVMSDWYGIKDRPASLLAGNDLGMPESRRDKKELKTAILKGEIPDEVLNNACRRMLVLIDKVHRNRRPMQADFQAHHQLAQRIAAESLVLLKNEDLILPIDVKKVNRIAVIGKPAIEPVIQGSGCATTVPYLQDRPLDEIFDIAGEHCHIEFEVGTPQDHQLDEAALKKAQDVAKRADVAIVFVSTAIGEDGENGDRQDLAILPTHEALIEAIAKVQPNFVVVLANGDAVVMPWLSKAKGLLECFFAGQGMGRAVAETLFGLNNPSGKLTVTMPHCLEETPAFLTYPGENRRHYYSESFYVGYRYYDKRKMTPLFPFGFGLSYTKFDYLTLRLSAKILQENESLTVSVTVKNSGACAGKEVVQIYVKPPACRLSREVQSLKAFTKVTLAQGESQTVNLQLDWRDFAYYDPAVNQWVVDRGEYQICAAKSSRDVMLMQKLVVNAPVRYPEINLNSSIVELMENPPVFDAVAKLVAAKGGLTVSAAKQEFAKIAQDLFCGLLIALTEMLELAITREELTEVLKIQSLSS